MKEKDNICFILYGSRNLSNMKCFGPKHFYRNHQQKTLLAIQIDNILSNYSHADIILTIGYDADRILKNKDSRIRYIENQLFSTTNEVEDIRLAINSTNSSKVVLINSDLYFNKYTLQGITQSTIIYDTRHQISEFEVGITTDNNYATRLDFKLDKKWCNIISLEDDNLRYFKNLCNRQSNRLFLFEIINLLLDKNVKIVTKQPVNMVVSKIDNPENYRKFQTQPNLT